jgi:hypothetical protein
MDPKENEKEISGDVPEVMDDIDEADNIGLEELAADERLEEEDLEMRDLRGIPSDLRSVGDPNAGDVGIPGGLAAGGEESLGGSGGLEKTENEELEELD